MLRMVEERDEGILVRGWKAVGTANVFANWLNIGIFWNVGTQSDQVIFCRVPANLAGITHVARDSYAKPDSSEYDYPFSSFGDELEAMTFFDDVVVPWEYIFHLGNVEHAQYYPQRVFDWVHIETQNRQIVNAELLVGLALLLTNSLGTAKHPVVASQLADIIRFRETTRAFTIAAEDTGNTTPGGL
jgi:4-hydroxyphenylacetate 3-monooxygenase